jgi:hypothetical protein
MERVYLDKACEATAFAVLVTNVAGFASALANAWSSGWHGNQVQTMLVTEAVICRMVLPCYECCMQHVPT